MNVQNGIKLTPCILRDDKLCGWEEEIAGRWHYNDLEANESWKSGWISFDALAWNRGDGKLYCGLNAMDSDILYRFDPITSQFENLNTRLWTDQFDVKIHRTLLQEPGEGKYYFGTSLLHDADRQEMAMGGKLVSYDWRNDSYEVLGIPIPHLYIQSIAADWSRGLLYGFTYPAEFLFRFDLNDRSTRNIAYIGNAIMFAQPHNGVVDRYGNLWGTYAETRAWDERVGHCPIRVFRFDTEREKVDFFDFGLSRKNEKSHFVNDLDIPDTNQDMPDMTESRHKEDFGFCDSMAYDGERYIYAGTVAGVLCRIDIEKLTVEKIANLMPSGRCPALGFDAQKRVLAAGGMKNNTALSRFDPKTNQVEFWGQLADNKGRTPARIHDLAVDESGTVWLAENDNHQRSSYLWKAKVGD